MTPNCNGHCHQGRKPCACETGRLPDPCDDPEIARAIAGACALALMALCAAIGLALAG